MNTKYTVAAGLAKKKNAKAGRGSLLKGYTVGSLAPPSSVSSGNKAVFGYGIDNRCTRATLRSNRAARGRSAPRPPLLSPDQPPCLR